MNPLLFIPSPRDIPAVKKLWRLLPYDKFIVKYKPQIEAYREAKKFFLTHKEYTHIVLCPDDLEIDPIGLNMLLEDANSYEIISGYCNLDESHPDIFALQPTGIDYSPDKPRCNYGAWYMKNKNPKLPTDSRYFAVGHSGCACCVISRRLFKQLSFHGANGTGWYDWQISKDCYSLGVPLMIDLGVFFWHRRSEQKVRSFEDTEGYSFLWTYK